MLEMRCEMNKKVVMITGAAKGIGAATALEFAKNNYDLILHYNKSKEEVECLKQRLETEYKVNVLLVRCDLTSELEITKMISKINNMYSHIDVLVNNAALSLDCYISNKTKEEFMKVLEVNLVAPFLLVKYLSNNLDKGVVINVSSTDADNTGNVYNIDYSASKAGLNSITRTLSIVYPNIRICGIMPNWVKTEAILEMEHNFLESELKRIGQKELIKPEEVAKKILNIVQDETYKTGSIIRLDGECCE